MLSSYSLAAKKPQKTETTKKNKTRKSNMNLHLECSMWLQTCNRGKKWEGGKQRSCTHLADFVLLQMLSYIFEFLLSEDNKKITKLFFPSFPLLSSFQCKYLALQLQALKFSSLSLVINDMQNNTCEKGKDNLCYTQLLALDCRITGVK